MSARDVVHPVKRKRSRNEKVSLWQDFGHYQLCMLAATQISYMPIAASILSTSFMKMSKEACALVLEARNGTSGTMSAVPEGEFQSLLTLWALDCTERAQSVQTVISTMIMLGGLVGAIISGFVADRWGRKPVVIATLSLVSAANGLLLLASHLSWPATLPIFFLLGAATGGYMTTNLVLVVESLCLPASRLLVVALNGWSLSMAGIALLAALCPHWFQYHLAVAVIAALCAGALFCIADESLRWLRSSHKVERFDRAAARLAKFNGCDSLKDVPLLCQLERDGAVQARSLITSGDDSAESGNTAAGASLSANSMSYLDLFAERSLRPRLLSLGYCFFCSSIVSFGFYFAFDSLSGNRYATMAIGGGGKFVLGLLPFVVSSCVSRKQVALISVAAAALAAWAVLACLLFGVPLQSLAVTVLSLVATAALDPTWKISHLYSTELFPTNVRNMARGFCNSAARIGSVLAPLVSHLRHDQPHVSFGVFALLLTGQFAITALFLPNEAPTDLPDSLPAAPVVPTERRRKQKTSEFDEDDERSRENSSQLSESAPLTP
ncbi:hypothetical protein PFISCL1PPCAC_22974 [Pristionchus fissidentatus]|uniref:Membrane transporter n=1 Tax=Pristionchus fissidentatus TaxID=1538716 RepID=A0AAV5WPD5_9BILA|nr:hypothetical protein PFISCL1PPCAC_22974 [Pristionchus fissidentatus]